MVHHALTLDLKAAGWLITSNEHLIAHTDLMPTMQLLLAQRNRWTLGTIDELRKRGWNRHTAPSITMMMLGLAGILYTAIWASVSARSFARYGAHVELPYLAWMAFWMFYQVQSVRHMGWRIASRRYWFPSCCSGLRPCGRVALELEEMPWPQMSNAPPDSPPWPIGSRVAHGPRSHVAFPAGPVHGLIPAT